MRRDVQRLEALLLKDRNKMNTPIDYESIGATFVPALKRLDDAYPGCAVALWASIRGFAPFSFTATVYLPPFLEGPSFCESAPTADMAVTKVISKVGSASPEALRQKRIESLRAELAELEGAKEAK